MCRLFFVVVVITAYAHNTATSQHNNAKLALNMILSKNKGV